MTRLFITQFFKSDLNYTNPQGQQPRMKNSGWAPGMFCIILQDYTRSFKSCPVS